MLPFTVIAPSAITTAIEQLEVSSSTSAVKIHFTYCCATETQAKYHGFETIAYIHTN
jgi:hypothetical protein